MFKRNEAIIWMATVEGWTARELSIWFGVSTPTVVRLIHRWKLNGWAPPDLEIAFAKAP